MRHTIGLTILAFALSLGSAYATPFTITGTLTGDPRLENPDNIVITTTVTGDTTSNVTSWVIDLNSPLHPNIALHEFAFNLVGLFTDYSFSNFSPDTWNVVSGDNVPGSGGADFIFQATSVPNNVTNSVNLTFDVTRLTGNFLVSHFLTAPASCSNDVVLGCGQLGAHVGSLTAGQGQGDSGFAMGNYTSPPNNPPPPPAPIPEPTTLTLLGSGMLAAAWRRRRARAATGR